MIASKPILEKLSAKDRKTIDAHLAEYRQHTRAQEETQSERGKCIESNIRRRHKLEKHEVDSSDRKAMIELAERHAREVSEAPHKKDVLWRASRTHKKKADKALSKIWPMLIEPAEELLAEYQERDRSDQERFGVSAPGITEEIRKAVLVLRKAAGQTEGLKPWVLERVAHVGPCWLVGRIRITDKGQTVVVEKAKPSLMPEDDPEFFTKNPHHPAAGRGRGTRDILPTAKELMQ